MIRLPRLGRKGAKTPARIGEPTIRPERPEDSDPVRTVIEAAFAGHPHSEGNEAAIVDALREDGDLALSLVAASSRGIVGHIAFSPALLSTGEEGWFVAGPVSVEPSLQKMGVGRALIDEGIGQLRKRGASGVVLVGDPDFYTQFGFRTDTALTIEGELGAYFQVLSFGGPVPDATIHFAPAFDMPGDTTSV